MSKQIQETLFSFFNPLKSNSLFKTKIVIYYGVHNICKIKMYGNNSSKHRRVRVKAHRSYITSEVIKCYLKVDSDELKMQNVNPRATPL